MILIIESYHLGGGGVDSRRRVIFDNPGLENRISVFLMISGLLVQLLAKERHLHNVYKPPPPYLFCRRRGGGVAERGQSTAKGAWCLERAQSMIWLYLLYVEWMPTIGLTPVNNSP